MLTNVKTRGTWGEVQLEALLEQLLTVDQYAKNVATVPKSGNRVEFAIKLPGRQESADGVAVPVWLPIDSKFPREDYERLVDAQERADPVAVEEASRALEASIRTEARAIADKYVSPPHTTDFALLFLPTEGLYAEILRRPGLTDFLQREYRVSIAGPTTLTALLNSLQMVSGRLRSSVVVERSVAGARRGEDGIREVRRHSGEDKKAARNGHPVDRRGGTACPRDEPYPARRRGDTGEPVAELPGDVFSGADTEADER